MSSRKKSSRKGVGAGEAALPADEAFDKLIFGSAMFTWERKKMMTEYCDKGHAPVHLAIFEGDLRKLRRFLEIVEDLVELPVLKNSRLCGGYSPLMCAVYAGHKHIVTCLVDNGAKVDFMTHNCHTVIDVCIEKQNKPLFDYFFSEFDAQLQPLSKLVKYLQSNNEAEVLLALKFCLLLSKVSADEESEKTQSLNYVTQLAEFDVLKILRKIIEGSFGYSISVSAFECISNMIGCEGVLERLLLGDMVSVLLQLLRSTVLEKGDQKLFQPISSLLRHLCEVKPSDLLHIQGHFFILEHSDKIECQETLSNLIGCLVFATRAVPRTADELIQSKHSKKLLDLYLRASNKDLVIVCNSLLEVICEQSERNQQAVTDLGVTEVMVQVISRSRSLQVQESSIRALRANVEKNRPCQDKTLEFGALNILGDILKKNRQSISSQTACVSTLWTLVRDDLYRRRLMAASIGAELFLEYLAHNTDTLSVIATEALEILATGPNSQAEQIGVATVPLLSLSNHSNPDIAIGSLRLLRRIAIGRGFFPIPRNAEVLRASSAIKSVLSVHQNHACRNVSMEAAVTISHMSVENPEFELDCGMSREDLFRQLLSVLESDSEREFTAKVGEALAVLVYNRAEDVGTQQANSLCFLRFKHFEPVLQDKICVRVVDVAFQVVCLSPLFGDKSPAESAAAGIRLLMKSLRCCLDPLTQLHTCDVIARLTRRSSNSSIPGVLDAVVALDAVSQLSNLVHSPDPHVSWMATQVLATLSYNHCSQRQLLNSCRKDALVQQLLLGAHREQRVKLSGHFVQQWGHYQSVGLPNHQFCNQHLPPPSSMKIIRAASKCMQSVAALQIANNDDSGTNEHNVNKALDVTSFATDKE